MVLKLPQHSKGNTRAQNHHIQTGKSNFALLLMLKGSKWSEVHHLRLHSSKGTTTPYRQFLTDNAQRFKYTINKSASASADSETLQLPFTHLSFISHCFLELRGFLQAFYFQCPTFYFPFSSEQCMYSAMFATDLQNCWCGKSLNKDFIASLLGEPSYFNYPCLLIFWHAEGFSGFIYLSWHWQCLTLANKNVCLRSEAFLTPHLP